ncbi:MAG: hypothetical protein IJW86_09145 [Clostridia bacterium]|nr:hypothetical protein [Clostridia bacterium]
MKIAYRIITPIIAVGAIVMGLLLKLFYFVIGGASDEITSIVNLAQQFGVKTNYEYSAYEIIKMLMGADLSGAEEGAESFMAIAEPILPHVIAFVVFFVLALLMFLAVGIVSAVTCNRKAVIGMSAGGLLLCFIGIVIARVAFDKIIGGEINLSDIVGMFSDSAWVQILATVVTVSKATLSTGFYAVFGMYILTIIWSILANMLIKTPITIERKHRRRKPLPRPSAVFHR